MIAALLFLFCGGDSGQVYSLPLDMLKARYYNLIGKLLLEYCPLWSCIWETTNVLSQTNQSLMASKDWSSLNEYTLDFVPEFWNGSSQLGSAHTNLLHIMVCASLQSLQVQQPRELHDFLHSVLLSIHIQHPLWIRYCSTDKSNMLKTYGPCNTAIYELLPKYEPLLHLNPCIPM